MCYLLNAEYPFGRYNPEAPEQVKDFQALIGECKCKSVNRKKDQSWNEPEDMIWRWKYIMNGKGVQDETLKADGGHSGSIRQFDKVHHPIRRSTNFKSPKSMQVNL